MAVAAGVAFLATGCADVTSERVEPSEPAETAEPVDVDGVFRPSQAVGNACATEEATVVAVIDGDTVDAALVEGGEERVRLPQVDTPEIHDCGYPEATAALEELLRGRRVTLVATEAGPDRDSHGRLLRAVEVDGEDVGQLLVRSGIARWSRNYAHEDSQLAVMYEAAERHAEQASAGLWSTCSW